LHGGQSTSSEILAPVTDVTGSDDISDAHFARDFGGWDVQVPTATKIKIAGWILRSGRRGCGSDASRPSSHPLKRD
jgi:hypothetical protein